MRRQQCGGGGLHYEMITYKVNASENYTNKNNKNNNIYVPKTARARGQKLVETLKFEKLRPL